MRTITKYVTIPLWFSIGAISGAAALYTYQTYQDSRTSGEFIDRMHDAGRDASRTAHEYKEELLKEDGLLDKTREKVDELRDR